MNIDPNRIISISSKRTYDTCPRKWAYRNELGYDAREMTKPLARGIDFHTAAEASYSGQNSDAIDTRKKVGYDTWVKRHEDLIAQHTEVPMVIPLEKLWDFCWTPECPENQERRNSLVGWYYGGVADLVARHKDGTSWVADHKTVERFYTFPTLYSTEQLIMYCIGFEILYGRGPTGGIISRVKQMEGNPIHRLNYVLKALKEESISLTKTIVKDILYKYGILAHPKKKVKVDSEPHSPKVNKMIVKTRESGLHLSFTRRDENGYVVRSVESYRGVLVDLRREYFRFTPDELKAVGRDFLVFASTVVAGHQERRRTPGLHCSFCPFREACEAERRLPGDPLGACLDPEKVEKRPLNPEIIEALVRKEERQREQAGVGGPEERGAGAGDFDE